MHESKFPFVSRIEFIRSKLSNFSTHVSGVTVLCSALSRGLEGQLTTLRITRSATLGETRTKHRPVHPLITPDSYRPAQCGGGSGGVGGGGGRGDGEGTKEGKRRNGGDAKQDRGDEEKEIGDREQI